MIYGCCDENRRAAARGNPTLNGIDYLDVLDSEAPAGSPRQRTLLVYCLKPAPPDLTPDNVLIQGGERVTNVVAQWIAPASPPPPQASASEVAYLATLSNPQNILVVRTDVYGDFAPYTLRLVNSATSVAEDSFDVSEALAGFDPQLAEVAFSFKVECGPDFDCQPVLPDCAPPLPPPPPINYLAKDYGSFRTALLDRLLQLLPGWRGATEADIGVALAELIAYAGDQLSYQQDATATDAYLPTARSRISLRRHALLVDYRISDGCNARVFMQVAVSAPMLLVRSKTKFFTFAPGMPAQLQGHEQAALDAGVVFFEPMQDAKLHPDHNRLEFYTWGDDNCCLPQGATEATLLGAHPLLQPGDILVFKEVLGPRTGFPADADVSHRCAVRLTAVVTTDALGNPLIDPLFEQGTGAPIVTAAQKPTQVTEIRWATEDALPFPLCVSSKFRDSANRERSLSGVSAAFGNIVLADHGLTMPALALPPVPAPILFQPPATIDRCAPTQPKALPPFYRPRLPNDPLTQAVPLPLVGAPATPAPIPLASQGHVSLSDANGFVCLMAQTVTPGQWPRFFGVKAEQTGAAPTGAILFDLTIVFNPDAPNAPPGLSAPPELEKFTGLALKAGDLAVAIAKINALSRFLHASAAPPAVFTVAPFGPAPTNFPGAGALELQDADGILYLTPNSPPSWPPQFALLAQGDLQTPSLFNLLLLYQPTAGGVGVRAPIVVERFNGLSLATVQNLPSKLFALQSFEQAPSPSLSALALMTYDARHAAPAIALAADGAVWTVSPDLLAAQATDRTFVVEVEADGIGQLRFGDDANGKAPDAGTAFTADFRIGNGAAGNVGADSVSLFTGDSAIISCSNLLAASGGVEPETNEQIRRRAPQAFLTQERAVTAADYADATRRASAQIEDAAAELRWTGSWRTAFIAAEPQAGGDLSQTLRRSLYRYVDRFRLAGQDIKIESPNYVALEIELQVCVDPSYFQSDVRDAVKRALTRDDPASGHAALFAPGSFKLGQTVYLSPIYAAARRVAGVRTVSARVFYPQGRGAPDLYLRKGEIPLGPFQAARLDNDPSAPDHGRLTLVMSGGK